MSYPAPNWYDDPQHPAYYRYWDGTSWTGHVSPKYRPSQPSTPDGVPLASWGERLGARLLDGLILSLAGLPFTGYFLYHYVQEANQWSRQIGESAARGDNPDIAPPAELWGWLAATILISVLVGVVYEAVFLRRGGATPGKRIVGIRVRQRDREGQLSYSVIARRVLSMQALQLLPLIGLLNGLSPLWDAKKQAWHDKAAGTNVVRANRS